MRKDISFKLITMKTGDLFPDWDMHCKLTFNNLAGKQLYEKYALIQKFRNELRDTILIQKDAVQNL